MDLLLKPARAATSKPAQRTYLNTLLVLIASTILLGVAIVAYWLFYFAYIPQIGISRVIHLQYGEGLNPYGIAKLDNTLISQQPYDISLALHVPLSPTNLAQGNFMLSLSLLSSSYTPPPQPTTHLQKVSNSHKPPPSLLTPPETLHSSRRPTLITYNSYLISLISRLLALPLYLLGLRTESERLLIPMFERLEFPRGKGNVPEYIMLEILQATRKELKPIQVYDVSIHFAARFGGLRWVMYNHRILSSIIFTTIFWGVEVFGLLMSWLLLRMFFSPAETGEGKRLKLEDEDTAGETIKSEDSDEVGEMSDTERTFPTYGRRKQPLRYEGRVKSEEEEDYKLDEVAQPVGLEADDEEEEEDDGIGRDSGLGTSFSESPGRGVARRRSKGKMVGGGSIGN